MNTIVQVVPKPDHHVHVTFMDGFKAELDMRPYLWTGIAVNLLASVRFAEVTIEPGGGIAWPNGFDICPEFLRQLAEKHQAEA